MTSGRISMIALENVKLPLDGRLSSAFGPFSSAEKSSYAAAPARMSAYKQAPYYYYYY